MSTVTQVLIILTKISCHPIETDNPGQPQGRFQYAGSLIISFGSGKCSINYWFVLLLLDGADINCHGFSQRHPSNWVDADEDDDEGDETELCVQSTPPYS